MRNAFVKALTTLATRDRNIYLLTGDLGFTVFEEFARSFPNQYINCGVAEQNMMGVAAGLSLSGKKVFVYSIIPFATMRPFEQIRNDICMHNLDVTIVGVGGGFSYGSLGPTHHAIEDIAIMRALPNMRVVVPADPVETDLVVRAIAKETGPTYLRLGKSKEETLSRTPFNFALEKARILKRGRDLTLIGIGPILKNVLAAAEALEKNHHLSATVASMTTVKPIDTQFIVNTAKTTKHIFTIEEHSIIGGLGEAVGTILAEKKTGSIVFKRIGIDDAFAKIVGNQEYLREKNHLSPKELEKIIIQSYGNKK